MITTLLEQLKGLMERFDFLVLEGLNSRGFLSAFDMDINVEIAKNLGCPFISVMNGLGLTAKEVKEGIPIAHSAVAGSGCHHLALFVNRLPPKVHAELLRDGPKSGQDGIPLFFLPDVEELDHPTLADIVANTGARLVLGRQEDLGRVVRQCKIAAMTVENFLHYVDEGDLIIAAGDRSDIILASISSLFSPHYPNIAGLLLTGGFVPGSNVMRLLKDRPLPVPVLSIKTDTYSASRAVDRVPATSAQ